MQISTISDSTKAISDTSTERVTSLITRVGARAVAQQNQQQFATFLADEQANSNTSTENSLERTAKNAKQSNNDLPETTPERETDPVRSDRGIRDAQTCDEDPPPENEAQDMHMANTTDTPMPVREPTAQEHAPTREDVADNVPEVPSDDTVQAEVLALAALRNTPLIPREVTPVTPVVSSETASGAATQSDPVGLLSITATQLQPPESAITKGVAQGTTQLTDVTLPAQDASKLLNAAIPVQGIEAASDAGNLVLAQIVDTVDAGSGSSPKSDFSMLLAASSEAVVSGDTKAIKENIVAAGSTSAENLIITGTQTAAGKSLTEMAVAFLPDQGRGGERAGPEDGAVSSENRSSGTPVVGVQAMSSKSLFSVRPAGMTSASAAPVVDLAVETVRYMTANGEKTMTVRLSPSSLGDMRIEISTVNDVLNVKLVSANPTARDLLNQHVDILRDALAQGGMEVGRVSVTSGFGSTANSHLSQQQSGAWSQGSFSTSTAGNFSLTAATEDAPLQRSRRVAYYNGALDVSV